MKKMKLNSLSVKSFATSLDKKLSHTAKGGNTTKTETHVDTGQWIVSCREGCISNSVSSVHASYCPYSL